ncbi:MAG: hypothetical protein JKX79_05005 [Labilibaculum sp.]|nr:hypothetical protein [Labilibaculum sp.]
MNSIVFRLDNGWTVTKNENGVAVLHVTPIEGSLFRKEQFVNIPDDVFNDIRDGEREIKELFRKFKLHNLIFQWEREPVVSKKYENTEFEFYGRDFLVTQEGEHYFIEYELSQHGGGHRKFEISKEIYEDARKGDKSTFDLFKKYNLYHLNIPENDVS